MKNARIGLLVLSVFAFAKMECKSSQTPSKNPPVKKATRSVKPQKRVVTTRRVAQSSRPVIVEEDSHKIEVNEEMLKPGQIVQASVDTHVTENKEDNTITEVTVTVTPMPEEGKVVTTTETWTWKDYAKVAVGVGVAAGASYAAYKYHTDPTFVGQVNDSGSWASEQANNAYQAGSQALASGYEKTKAFGQEVGQSLDNAWQSTTQKANDLKSKWNNLRSSSLPASTALEVSAPAESSDMNESNQQVGSAPAESSDMNESNQQVGSGQDPMPELEQNGKSLFPVYSSAPGRAKVPARAEVPAPADEIQPTKSSWFGFPMMNERLKDTSNRLGDASIATGGDL